MKTVIPTVTEQIARCINVPQGNITYHCLLLSPQCDWLIRVATCHAARALQVLSEPKYRSPGVRMDYFYWWAFRCYPGHRRDNGGFAYGIFLAILTLCFMVLVLSLGHHVAVCGISYLLIVAIVSGQCLVTVPVVQPSSTMDGGEGEVTKRVTRQSVSEASAATKQTGDSFEDFVRKSLTSMGAKMDSILAGQAALENRCDSIETRVTQNETVIQDTIDSLDFNSDQVKDLFRWNCQHQKTN